MSNPVARARKLHYARGMASSSTTKRRYVVLPARGISGEVMQADVFAAPMPRESFLGETRKALSAYESFISDEHSELQPAIETLDEAASIDVVSQYFLDGPAVVKMTDAGRNALIARHPNLRIVPLTRYALADAMPAASAVMPGGGVYSQDCKQFYIAATAKPDDGAGVIVGVIDTGVEGQHPALAGKVVVSRSLIPGEDPGAGGQAHWPGDSRAGHGTHVAGIIAGAATGGAPAGVAPGARIASYRVFPNAPVGGAASNPAIIDAVRAAMDDGCHVINLSLRGRSLKEDGVRSAISEAWDNGVLCIAAAGNDNRRPVGYPAALSTCVAVSAMGREGCFPEAPEHRKFVSTDLGANDPAVFVTSFTNVGPQIKFAAPGHAIVAAGENGGWDFRSGTSMAAPFVSGVMAVLLSKNPNVLNALGNGDRSAAMLQMLIARSKAFGFSSQSFEGYGVPLP